MFRRAVSALTIWTAVAAGLSAQGMKSEAPSNTTEKTRFAVVPIPNYNEASGFGLGAIASLFYPVDREDAVSPASSTTLFAFYASNKTAVLGLAQKFHLKEDTYRVSLALAAASINYQFYDEWITGDFIDYNASSGFLLMKGSRRILPGLFLGLKYRFTRSRTTLDIPGDYDPPLETYSGLGPILSFDSRDSVFYPSSGSLFEFESLFNHEALGSESNYAIFEMKANLYRRLGPNGVLALRLAARIGAGDVPFNDQTILVGTDLRGYSSGRYRADQKYCLQGEYRWFFRPRFGGVIFAGFGYVVDRPSQIRLEDTLPSAGAGLRFRAIPDMGVNVGVDVGFGKEGASFYFRIMEAF
jgi:outer membrane protein assembly factor BamA